MKRHVVAVAGIALIVAFSGGRIAGEVPDVATNTWAPGPSLIQARYGATATALSDGNTLVAGGRGADGVLASAELITAAGVVVPVASMGAPRADHVAVALPDGRVLIAGGTTTVLTEEGTSEAATGSAQIYDAGAWYPVAPLAYPRAGASAVVLPDGRAAVVGGRDANGPVLPIEVYDPAAGAFVAGGSLSAPRDGAAVAVSRGGSVIAAGGTVDGVAQATADIVDPVTGTVATVALVEARAGATATALVNDTILIAGGSNAEGILATTEVLDPVAGWSLPSVTLSAARHGHRAFSLKHNGGVLLVGGADADGAAVAPELVLPWAGVSQSVPVSEARTDVAGANGPEEGVHVVAGGRNDAGAHAATEYFGFATVKTDKDDYAPGEFVTITGAGWQPGETVQLMLHEVGTGAPDMPLNAVADEQGNIFNDFWAPSQSHVGVRFYLTATGVAASAQTTFTDGNPQNLSLAPSSVTVYQGKTATYLVTVRMGGNFAPCTVTLGLTTPLPDGATASFVNPASPGTNDNVVTQNPGNVDIVRELRIATTESTDNPITFIVQATRGEDCQGNGNLTATGTLKVDADTTPPVVTVPADITLEATGPGGAVATFSATANDIVDGSLVATCAPASGSTFGLGTTGVTCSATDAAGNTGSASFNVTVQDTMSPELQNVPADVTVEATGPTGAVATYTDPAATDLVDTSVAVVCAPPSGSTFPLGATTVTCTATDDAGNSSQASFTVTVVDTTAPTLTLPADVTAEATSSAGAAVTFTATATDLVDGALAPTCVPASGSTFPLGPTVVSCSVTDAAGNTATGSFSVTVQDTTPPVVTVPGDITLEATGPGGAVATFTATATDVVDGSLVPMCAPASGSTFALGTTEVTCSSTDAAGNTGSASFNVKVQDTTPPELQNVPADVAVEATGPTGAVATYTDPTATDLVDTSVAVVCAPPSGSTFPLGPTTVTCTATDDAGNSSQASFTVTVVDTTPPTGSILINAGAAYTTTANVMLALTCSDVATGCVGMQFSQDGIAYTAFEPFAATKGVTLTGPDGARTVYVRFKDGADNVSSAFSDTIVLDTTPPVITIVAPANGGAYALNQPVAASYSCSDVTSGIATCAGPVASGADIDTATVGFHSFTVNASDQAGNTASVTHTYNVNYVFTGFFSPVNNGVWNVVNAGRAIPLKWQLTDGLGSFILDLNTVESISYYQVPCASEVISVPIEGLADDAGASELRITGTEYHFNWKTAKNFANKCLELRVLLDDGSAPHIAKFKFTK